MPAIARRSLFALGAATIATARLANPAPAIAQAPARKRVVFVVSNPTNAPFNGMEIGYWLPELAHPYWAFVQKGYDVVVASPQGGEVRHDQMSDPEGGRFGNPADLVSIGFKNAAAARAAVGATQALAEIHMAEFDAIFVVGGFAPPVTFMADKRLPALFAEFHDAGKIAAAICHGTCVLLEARGRDGKLIAEGKRWTGYTNAEEDVVDRVFGGKFQPFRIEDEAKKIAGTQFVQGPAYRPHAVVDGRLITGQQGSSGLATAELVIAAFERV